MQGFKQISIVQEVFCSLDNLSSFLKQHGTKLKGALMLRGSVGTGKSVAATYLTSLGAMRGERVETDEDNAELSEQEKDPISTDKLDDSILSTLHNQGNLSGILNNDFPKFEESNSSVTTGISLRVIDAKKALDTSKHAELGLNEEEHNILIIDTPGSNDFSRPVLGSLSELTAILVVKLLESHYVPTLIGFTLTSGERLAYLESMADVMYHFNSNMLKKHGIIFSKDNTHGSLRSAVKALSDLENTKETKETINVLSNFNDKFKLYEMKSFCISEQRLKVPNRKFLISTIIKALNDINTPTESLVCDSSNGFNLSPLGAKEFKRYIDDIMADTQDNIKTLGEKESFLKSVIAIGNTIEIKNNEDDNILLKLTCKKNTNISNEHFNGLAEALYVSMVLLNYVSDTSAISCVISAKNILLDLIYESKFSITNAVSQKIKSAVNIEELHKNMKDVYKHLTHDDKPDNVCGNNISNKIYIINSASGFYYNFFHNTNSNGTKLIENGDDLLHSSSVNKTDMLNGIIAHFLDVCYEKLNSIVRSKSQTVTMQELIAIDNANTFFKEKLDQNRHVLSNDAANKIALSLESDYEYISAQLKKAVIEQLKKQEYQYETKKMDYSVSVIDQIQEYTDNLKSFIQNEQISELKSFVTNCNVEVIFKNAEDKILLGEYSNSSNSFKSMLKETLSQLNIEATERLSRIESHIKFINHVNSLDALKLLAKEILQGNTKTTDTDAPLKIDDFIDLLISDNYSSYQIPLEKLIFSGDIETRLSNAERYNYHINSLVPVITTEKKQVGNPFQRRVVIEALENYIKDVKAVLPNVSIDLTDHKFHVHEVQTPKTSQTYRVYDLTKYASVNVKGPINLKPGISLIKANKVYFKDVIFYLNYVRLSQDIINESNKKEYFDGLTTEDNVYKLPNIDTFPSVMIWHVSEKMAGIEEVKLARSLPQANNELLQIFKNYLNSSENKNYHMLNQNIDNTKKAILEYCKTVIMYGLDENGNPMVYDQNNGKSYINQLTTMANYIKGQYSPTQKFPLHTKVVAPSNKKEIPYLEIILPKKVAISVKDIGDHYQQIGMSILSKTGKGPLVIETAKFFTKDVTLTPANQKTITSEDNFSLNFEKIIVSTTLSTDNPIYPWCLYYDLFRISDSYRNTYYQETTSTTPVVERVTRKDLVDIYNTYCEYFKVNHQIDLFELALEAKLKNFHNKKPENYSYQKKPSVMEYFKEKNHTEHDKIESTTDVHPNQEYYYKFTDDIIYLGGGIDDVLSGHEGI